MRTKDIKLLAIDLDGTLLNSRHQLGPGNREALRRAIGLGMHVVIATGKQRCSALELIDELGIRSPGIFLQGLLTTEADGSLRRQVLMDARIAAQTIAIGESMGFEAIAYSGDKSFVKRRSPMTDRMLDFGEPPPSLAPDWNELIARRRLHKIALRGEEAGIAELRSALARQLGARAHITRAPVEGMLEVLPAGASKGEALRQLLLDLEVAPGQALAFGDGENDIEMLGCVGTGVAMANATEDLKAVADIIAPSNDDEGVAFILDRYILREEALAQ